MPRRVLAALSLLCTTTVPAAEPPRYIVQVIGGLEPTGSSSLVSFPLGLNNNGRTVGYAASSGSQSMIINWKSGAVSSVAPVPGTNRSYGSRVNILGRIAGAAYAADANGSILQSRAVRWIGLVPQDLGNLGGRQAAALGINDADRIVGYSTLPGESQVRAFLWQGGVIAPLPAPGGATQAYAYDISNTNFIAGVYGGPSPVRPLLWRNGAMFPLPIPAGARTGAASAVNDAGIAVGNYEINQFTGSFAAVAWWGGQMIDLGHLGAPVPYAIAADINNANQIVGTSAGASGNTGFVWMDGTMYDLRSRLLPGSPAAQIISAHAINDNGQIAAAAMIDGRITAVLLSPVFASTPTPASLSLLGGAGLFALRRRR